MPQRKNNSEPPPAMTWGRALPVVIAAGLFDLIGIFFEFFWFFGPALAAAYCSATVSDVAIVGGLLATGCAATATVGGAAVSAFTTPFGVIMAMAVAFIGFLAVGLWVVKTNARIFKANAAGTMWFVGGFGVSLTPLIGVIPAFSLTLWKLYRTQIRVEKAAYAKWKKEQAATQLQERRRQEAAQAQLIQYRADKVAQAEQEMVIEEEREQEEEQKENENEEVKREEEIPEIVAPLPTQQRPVTIPETRVWSPDSGVPPPMTPEYGWRTTPPPLPTQPPPLPKMIPPPLPVWRGPPPPPLPTWTGPLPPPLPASAHMTSPQLPMGVPNYTETIQPPPLPSQSVEYTNTSRMKERTTMNSDKRSVEQISLRNNAFIVHTIAESGDAQHHNENSNVSGKATYGDDMDIMLALEPSVSASSVTPGKKAQLWTGDGFILGGGQISEAGGSDQGTIAHGIKKRGNKTSSLEEIDEVVGRNKGWHRETYEKSGTFGMNELVVNNSQVFGFFQQAEKDLDGRYWMFSTETKKDSDMAKRMRKYGSTAFDNNMQNYRHRFATAQEHGIPLYIMTPEREVYEYHRVNDDGTVEIGKQLTPEEVAKGRAGLTTEKRKNIGEKILEKKIFRKEAIQKEAEEIIKSL